MTPEYTVGWCADTTDHTPKEFLTKLEGKSLFFIPFAKLEPWERLQGQITWALILPEFRALS